MEKRVLIIGSGDISFRGYILRTLYDQGFSIVLLSEQEPGWERPWIEDCLVANFSSVEDIVRDVRAYHEQKAFQGVFTYVDLFVELATLLACELGLVGSSPEAALHARNKYLMRSRLREAGLLQPACYKYDGNLAALLKQVGFPSVVKPVAGHSSINVIKLDADTDVAEVEALLKSGKDTSEWSIPAEYMLEGYVDGAEVSVESIVSGGEVTHWGVTDKFKGEEPYFEEISHTVPSCLPEQVKQSVCEVVTRGIKALGLNNCAVHTEVRLSRKGPVIIEVGGRLGGGKIPYLVYLSSGADMALATGYAALGQRTVFRPQFNRFASIAFFTPTSKQTITGLPGGLPEVEGLVEFEFWGEVGQVVAPAPEQFFTRLGLVIVVADTYEQSRNRIKQAIHWLTQETGVTYFCEDMTNTAREGL